MQVLPGTVISYTPGGKNETTDKLYLFRRNKSPLQGDLDIRVPKGNGKTDVMVLENRHLKNRVVIDQINTIIDTASVNRADGTNINMEVEVTELVTLDHDGRDETIHVGGKNPKRQEQK